MTGTVANSRFGIYLRELRALVNESVALGGLAHPSIELAHGHLDGRAGRELRAAVARDELRRIGAFFTGEHLASQLLARARPETSDRIVDPACGCGDLLLAAARRLPVRERLDDTLQLWGQVLVGVDREPEFVQAARLRLALLALVRGASVDRSTPVHLASLLPRFVVGDGRDPQWVADASLVLLNPPYGQIRAPATTAWGSGRVTEAAIWVDGILSAVPVGAQILAVLPDVLRSGSRYSRWRHSIATRAEVAHNQSAGQFDALTDVDVTLMDLRRRRRPTTPEVDRSTGATLGERCRVMVGPVVDGRDPQEGPLVPYITTAELPLDGSFSPVRTRRFEGRLFMPPFVVVRRTSRPTERGPRLRAVVIRGRRPVAVENHLLVLQPSGPRSVAACEALVEQLSSSSVTDWLNERIRLRHLTVRALRELPVLVVGMHAEPYRPDRPGPQS